METTENTTYAERFKLKYENLLSFDLIGFNRIEIGDAEKGSYVQMKVTFIDGTTSDVAVTVMSYMKSFVWTSNSYIKKCEYVTYLEKIN